MAFPIPLGAIPVNIGPHAVPAALRALALRAEVLGYESLWTFEHVMVPRDYASRYPYHPSGKMGADPQTNFIDPLVAITYLAAQTKTLRFGTGVNILPQANPLLLAKQTASIDFLSGGRLLFGVGWDGWPRNLPPWVPRLPSAARAPMSTSRLFVLPGAVVPRLLSAGDISTGMALVCRRVRCSVRIRR